MCIWCGTPSLDGLLEICDLVEYDKSTEKLMDQKSANIFFTVDTSTAPTCKSIPYHCPSISVAMLCYLCCFSRPHITLFEDWKKVPFSVYPSTSPLKTARQSMELSHCVSNRIVTKPYKHTTIWSTAVKIINLSIGRWVMMTPSESIQVMTEEMEKYTLQSSQYTCSHPVIFTILALNV